MNQETPCDRRGISFQDSGRPGTGRVAKKNPRDLPGSGGVVETRSLFHQLRTGIRSATVRVTMADLPSGGSGRKPFACDFVATHPGVA